MNELYPSDAQLNALSGLTDAQQEVLFIATGESPYYTSFYKMLYRLLDVARRAGDLRVYKDGDLTFGVRAGRFVDGGTVRDVAALSAQGLADNATNYIYLTAAGALVVNATGFPAAGASPHIPLATVAAAGGGYSHADIIDYRGRAMFRPVTGLSAAAANAVKGGVVSVSIAAGAEAADCRRFTVQFLNAEGTALAAPAVVRVWISTADLGSPSAGGNSVAVYAGSTLQQVEANSHYLLATPANGSLQFDLTISGAATRYVMAEIGGRVFSSGAIAWNA